jgi:hypothetical protein
MWRNVRLIDIPMHEPNSKYLVVEKDTKRKRERERVGGVEEEGESEKKSTERGRGSACLMIHVTAAYFLFLTCNYSCNRVDLAGR